MKDTHVIPIDDLYLHDALRQCWCRPSIEEFTGGVLITHHALDGREYFEAALSADVVQLPEVAH